MSAVYGLYPDGRSAQEAVNGLRAAGIADRDIVVVSSQPMEDYEFGHMDKSTGMWWFACLGGVVGMSAGYGLVTVTEASWPMRVGGLPTVAWWPNLIILFEMTMLGAILATIVTFVVSALLSRGRLYDPAVADGAILVGVENAADDWAAVANLTRALRAPPGARVKAL
ncbi:MAG: hypothetical protein A3F70_13295 [Acidobacteria bacterium RIFCSPLOWO2_12_FULL_67_14]|nr:MAG: hypothetical protein A3H29_13015 [Acidobacteria bacterium RIFCSPLOWO2_02_FULL_67_21]OFW39187.1 MAG: hypothetical protein A3F70_13295 [Acidobacteria bacterium RIFCSPLOWO2_12_FULL_67_14]